MKQEKIGKFIAQLRKEQNMSQEELAKKLCISRQAISKWEVGRTLPDAFNLQKISEIFNVDIKEIINGEDNKKEPKKNKKKYLVLGIIILLILIILLAIIYNKDDKSTFNFKPITSENSCFGVKGVIAYNKNKKSIYISKIECSEEEKKEYLDVECILYEKNNSIEKIIYEEGKILSYDNYDKSNAKSINELLSNIEFNIDSYDCSCNNATCNNLYLRVNALNIDDKIVTYNIPLELENKCNN